MSFKATKRQVSSELHLRFTSNNLDGSKGRRDSIPLHRRRVATALPSCVACCLATDALNLDFMPSKAADTGAADSEHLFLLRLILQDLESVLWEAPQLFICQAAGWFLKPLLKARGQVGSRRCRLSAAAKWNAPSVTGGGHGPEKAKKILSNGIKLS